MTNQFQALHASVYADGIDHSKAIDEIVNRPEFKVRYRFYYPIRLTAYLVLMIASLFALNFASTGWQVAVVAFVAALFTVQIGLIAHDLTHGGVVSNKTTQHWLGIFLWNLALGLSKDWWADKHYRHHTRPNIEIDDPDLYFLLTYTEEEARAKKGILGWVAKYQAPLYPIIVTLLYPYFQYRSVIHLAALCRKSRFAEITGFVVHYALFLTAVFAILPWALALVFLAVYSLVISYYMTLVFSPNHIGLPILPPEQMKIGSLEQLLISRNVNPSWWADWLFGGVHYQIEHHVAHYMPRYHQAKASLLIAEYCREHKIPYNQTSMIQAYREIFTELHRVGRSTRQKSFVPASSH